MNPKIKIHLADDHKVLVYGLKTLLQNNPDFDVVGISENGLQIFQEITNNQADVLIMDISMPQKDGKEVLKEFSFKGFPCKVIILSSHDDLQIIREVMDLGANAYLTKQCAAENITEAILTVMNGEEYYCKIVREKIFNTSLDTIKETSVTLQNTVLTPREIEVLTLIALEFSGKEISEMLFISTNTVETHRKNLMKKLDAKNTISLVKFALKYNLIKE